MFELDPRRRDELLEVWAQRIVARGWAAPAVFLLEAHVPLAGLGAQVLTAFQPLVAPLLPVNVRELAAFLRRRENLENLVVRIEVLEAQRAARDEAKRG